jgi:hypothetical protein
MPLPLPLLPLPLPLPLPLLPVTAASTAQVMCGGQSFLFLICFALLGVC